MCFHLTPHWRTKNDLQIRRLPNFGAFLFCLRSLTRYMGLSSWWTQGFQRNLGCLPNLSTSKEFFGILKTMDRETKLSTLWIVVMFNMLLADVLSAFLAFNDPSVLNIPGDAKTMMAVSAAVINLPILMIYFSRSLSYRKNRITNLVVSIVTALFVVGGGSSLPHYLFIATVEIVCLAIIFLAALQWKETDKA